MPSASSWSQAVKRCADPERAKHFHAQLKTTPAGPSLAKLTREQARILAALLSGSASLSEQLLAYPDWLPVCLDSDGLRHPRRIQGLRREIDAWLNPLIAGGDSAAAMSRLRVFKQHAMLRIAARDLAGLGSMSELTREISDVADVTLDGVYRVLRSQFRARFGDPWHRNPDGVWQPTEFCILGMGKLGGQELNYSSDVDLLFVHAEEGNVFREPPARDAATRGFKNHQFFQRLIETLVAELTRLAPEGMLYRVDLRLRPEGESGPLARSIASYENYYAQWGQTWERMMLIKARCIAGDAALGAEFLETIQPFRYPRSLSERVLVEIAAMKRRIETEVVRAGELDRNVKLGRGGIREIEFIVQSLQLLQGGRQPFLQQAQTLPALEKMVQYAVIKPDAAQALTAAYTFLRNLEHRLQMEAGQQTHTIPAALPARRRLAALMGFATPAAFERQFGQHTTEVRRLYQALLRLDVPEPLSPLPEDFAGQEQVWHLLLANHQFKQIDKSLAVIRTFVEGPGYVHVSPRTVELARQLVCRLLEFCPRIGDDGAWSWPPQPLSDPDRVVARLDTYVSAYGSRAMLYDTWTGNPSLFTLLILLFDRSEFLAETAIRTPDLIEELVLSGQLRRRKTSQQILDELRHGTAEPNQQAWIRRYHQAEFTRLGLRDILGLADFEQNLAELSGLADACLQYALEAVMRQYGFKNPPFAIVGLGKLGGAELTYGSDLDITFVADSRAGNLPALQKLAARIIELLSAPTEYGVAFATDARLRPDGEKGLLVNTLQAYEDYYCRRAVLWEIQAISRTRTVAGDTRVGRRFCELAAQLSDFSQARPRAAAFRKDWMAEIHRMRGRIEKERTPPGKDALAIKTGRGGLMDAEFIAQALGMAYGWHEANTLKALERARDSQVLDTPNANRLLEHYRKLLHVECILRRWSFVGEAMLPDDPAPLYRVAVRCGYPTGAEFLKALTEHRKILRGVYDLVFAGARSPRRAGGTT